MASNTSSDKDTACSSSVSHSSGSPRWRAWQFQPFRCRLGPSVYTLAVFQTLLFMACCGQGSITPIAASNQSSGGVTPRATNGPAGLLHVTQRERKFTRSSDTTDKRQCDAQPQ
jgi:hypothetical protein